MCRNIRTLHNFEPPATEEEIRGAALQYVRKISGFTKPSQANTEAFERGLLTPEAWAERFIEAWEVDLTREEFLKKFTTWTRRVLPGAKELLAELRPHYRLAALSNSNAAHWQQRGIAMGPMLQ